MCEVWHLGVVTITVIAEGSLGHVGEESSVCIQKMEDGKFYLVHNVTLKMFNDNEGTYCVCVCMCVYVCVYVCVCIMCVYVCVYVCMYVHVYVCAYTLCFQSLSVYYCACMYVVYKGVGSGCGRTLFSSSYCTDWNSLLLAI